MDLVIWTKDQDSGDLVPYNYGDVEEVTITIKGETRMLSKKDTISIRETDKSLCI